MADTKVVIDCETGEEHVVELTADELAARDANAAAEAKRVATDAALVKAQETARTVIAAQLDPGTPNPTPADLLTALATIVGDAG